jgi:hypothetical protein
MGEVMTRKSGNRRAPRKNTAHTAVFAEKDSHFCRAAGMKLYHFTQPGDVLRIANEGLKPNVRDENAYVTGGVPVVWLTRQFDNIVTAVILNTSQNGRRRLARIRRPVPR